MTVVDLTALQPGASPNSVLSKPQLDPQTCSKGQLQHCKRAAADGTIKLDNERLCMLSAWIASAG